MKLEMTDMQPLKIQEPLKGFCNSVDEEPITSYTALFNLLFYLWLRNVLRLVNVYLNNGIKVEPERFYFNL